MALRFSNAALLAMASALEWHVVERRGNHVLPRVGDAFAQAFRKKLIRRIGEFDRLVARRGSVFAEFDIVLDSEAPIVIGVHRRTVEFWEQYSMVRGGALMRGSFLVLEGGEE